MQTERERDEITEQRGGEFNFLVNTEKRTSDGGERMKAAVDRGQRISI